MSHFADVKVRSRKIFREMLANPNVETRCDCGANPHSPNCNYAYVLDMAWELAEDEIWEENDEAAMVGQHFPPEGEPSPSEPPIIHAIDAGEPNQRRLRFSGLSEDFKDWLDDHYKTASH